MQASWGRSTPRQGSSSLPVPGVIAHVSGWCLSSMGGQAGARSPAPAASPPALSSLETGASDENYARRCPGGCTARAQGGGAQPEREHASAGPRAVAAPPPAALPAGAAAHPSPGLGLASGGLQPGAERLRGGAAGLDLGPGSSVLRNPDGTPAPDEGYREYYRCAAAAATSAAEGAFGGDCGATRSFAGAVYDGPAYLAPYAAALGGAAGVGGGEYEGGGGAAGGGAYWGGGVQAPAAGVSCAHAHDGVAAEGSQAAPYVWQRGA